PHDIRGVAGGGKRAVQRPEGVAQAVGATPPGAVPFSRRAWEFAAPAPLHDALAGAAPAVREYASLMDNVFGPVADDRHWHDGMNFYLNCFPDVDRHLGIVLDALEASGEGDRTIVVFTSDPRGNVGSHGLRQKGNLVYDENFHVPFIVRHPDFPGCTTSSALVSAVDITPTVLEVAGLDAAAISTDYPALHGHSLLPALEGASSRDG